MSDLLVIPARELLVSASIVSHVFAFTKRVTVSLSSGKHTDPVQAMFMRFRAHTCAYCQSIDEAHHKRHSDLAVQLRSIYENCGEVEWSIVPSEAEERGREREPGDQTDPRDGSITPDDVPSSKRERKDAKRLARAANRSKIITQDEIRYVDSVLHSADGISSNETDGPRNPEEIEEIEKNLRYHAQVYNTQSDRRGLREFAELCDTDADFVTEIERVLDVFRISELIKRNTKTRGLQGRDLKVFLALVDEFKHAVAEDIVLVKKDVLEIRMRRAGYLRYANRTAHSIVEDRYTNKDWKTGEKFTSSSSDSSGFVTPVEETGTFQK